MTAAENIFSFIFLLICTWTDLKRRSVYTAVIFPFLIAGTILFIIEGRIGDGAGGILLGSLLLLISFATKGAFGVGDALVLMVTGSFLGTQKNLSLFFLSLILSAVFSIGLMIFGKCAKDKEFPFVPFIFSAFILTNMTTVFRSLG